MNGGLLSILFPFVFSLSLFLVSPPFHFSLGDVRTVGFLRLFYIALLRIMEGGRNFTTAFYLFQFGAARSVEEPITRYNWNKVDGDVVR